MNKSEASKKETIDDVIAYLVAAFVFSVVIRLIKIALLVIRYLSQ